MKLFLDTKTGLDKIIANIFTMIGLWILLRHCLENKGAKCLCKIERHTEQS